MFPKNFSRFKACLPAIAVMVIVLVSSFKINTTTESVYIELQNQSIGITPKEFYISRLDDERSDKTGIGTLLAIKNTPGVTDDPSKVDLKGGTKHAVEEFMAGSVAINKKLRPIIIKLKTFNVTETAAATGRVAGRISMAVVFGYERDDDFIKLGDYATASTYQRNAGPAQQVEPMLRGIISNTLVYINNWMDKQAPTNIKLAKGVKVAFADYTEAIEGDTIYYNPNRPLKWEDFQLKPQSSRYAAEVFASLGYAEDVKIVQGIINIRLDIKVYLPKSACWARPDAMNSYSLVHEQHHFDIVKIVAERFKQKILAEKLDTYNYDGPINVAYFDALREIDVLQKQYDSETVHATNAYQQQQWNARIEKELLALGIAGLPAQAAGRN